MRITDDTRFPHPVLSGETSDFTAGEFSAEFGVVENQSSGALTLSHRVHLTEPALLNFVRSGRAVVGCFVRCEDTFYARLVRLSFPAGSTDFLAGELLNRVTLRPLLWLAEPLTNWNPGTINAEFEPPVQIHAGEVVGVAPEHIMSVGQTKFAPFESIFELHPVEAVAEGVIAVDPDHERIRILVAPGMFTTIGLLRGQANGVALLMNAVYLPAVMELLDILRDDNGQYQLHRWYPAVMAKCDVHGIDVNNQVSLLEAAQRLLALPAKRLAELLPDSE